MHTNSGGIAAKGALGEGWIAVELMYCQIGVEESRVLLFSIVRIKPRVTSRYYATAAWKVRIDSPSDERGIPIGPSLATVGRETEARQPRRLAGLEAELSRTCEWSAKESIAIIEATYQELSLVCHSNSGLAPRE